MRTKLFVFVILLLYTSLAYADYFDGNDLRKLMDSERLVDISMYYGYVAGIQDTFNGREFRVPPEVKLDQSSAIVSKYFKAHPEKWHGAAWLLVLEALKNAFPIKK